MSFLKLSATILASALGALAADPNLGRTVNFAYGNANDATAVPYNQSFILAQFAMIMPPASAVQPFILNQADLSPFTDLIDGFNTSGTYLYPVLGGNTSQTLSAHANRLIAQGYRSFTDRIQLTNVQGYANNSAGIADVYQAIEFCIRIGFNHIQLNPWPVDSNHALYPMPYHQVDSAVEQVQLDMINGGPASANWTPNPTKIHAILAYNSSIEILVNYENKPEEAALAALRRSAQIAAFNTTIQSIAGSFPGGRVHWTPPWSVNYDPIANGTWGFITHQLNSGDLP